MRTLYLCGRETSYVRNDVMIRALRRFSQVEVLGAAKRPASLAINSLMVALQAIPRLLFGRYDLVMVGFYGHLLMLPVGLFSRRPVLFDAFLSTYDTLIEDREVSKPGSLTARAALWLDRIACKLAVRVLLDTEHHVDYFVQKFGFPEVKFLSCPVSCNEQIFYPRKGGSVQPAVTRVIYYATYLPLHGVDIVVKAAALLQEEPIRFRLIGGGQKYNQVRELAQELGLRNVEFVPEMPIEELAEELAAADICLGGHFGSSDKATRVVPGKVYQILAMRRPLIASSTPANLEILEHGVSAYLCPPNDPESLAEAIQRLSESRALQQSLADGGHQLYLEKCSEAVITKLLQGAVSELVKG